MHRHEASSRPEDGRDRIAVQGDVRRMPHELSLFEGPSKSVQGQVDFPARTDSANTSIEGMMPSEFNIPSRRERHCEPCEFHKLTAALMGQPGNTWRQYGCAHPDAYEFGPLAADPAVAAKQGELRARIRQHPRNIGKTEKQPDWCPLRR